MERCWRCGRRARPKTTSPSCACRDRSRFLRRRGSWPRAAKYDAIVCIGCLLRGDTLHYDVIANEVTRGVGQSAQETGVPHAFGVLTCDTLEQAIDRAGSQGRQ